jgi:N-methylhydantoinase A/oxoprolinase/acetone carboxylase beta subunit
MLQVGADIGGTFSDVLLVGDGRRAVRRKTPTTPHDPSLAVDVVVRYPGRPDALVRLAHARTLDEPATAPLRDERSNSG